MKRLALIALLALAACKEESVELPAPVSMTAEAVGHYCQMDLLEHPGPKAQVHLGGMPFPLFFSQVRDALAYRIMPEQSHAIVAIYVNDMAAAPSWEDPGADNWINADTAVYVVGSAIAGGMGASELVPFSTEAGASAFVELHGGTIMALNDIPATAILAPDGDAPPATGDENEFLRRLQDVRQSVGG
jgi:copper chaperone NosL